MEYLERLSLIHILLPLSLIVGVILIVQGTPMGFDGKMKVTTMEGTTPVSYTHLYYQRHVGG